MLLLLHLLWRLQLINIVPYVPPSLAVLLERIETDLKVFLSSTEAQYVVNALWKGDLVQMNNDDEDIDYVPYETAESGSFWDHLNPQRISVPRYQAAFRIVVWIIFLFGAFTICLDGCADYQSTRRLFRGMLYLNNSGPWLIISPLETNGGIDPERRFDEWEYVLYIMTLAFLIEGKSSIIYHRKHADVGQRPSKYTRYI